MSGRLDVVGIGPGDPEQMTLETARILDEAEALFGYAPYLDRLPQRPGQTRIASDNREELARAGAALDHAERCGSICHCPSMRP